jgi:hypothetical protein
MRGNLDLSQLFKNGDVNFTADSSEINFQLLLNTAPAQWHLSPLVGLNIGQYLNARVTGEQRLKIERDARMTLNDAGWSVRSISFNPNTKTLNVEANPPGLSEL